MDFPLTYISTRGQASQKNFTEAATSGLASDGGLYMPETLPQFSLDTIRSWKNLPYTELAANVMWPFVAGTIERPVFEQIVADSYLRFRNPAIAPIHHLRDNRYVLELFHGPTLAFKDFALQFLGQLLNHILDEQKQDVLVIGATSGDTGSAAIAGCQGCPHIKLFMLHPYGRVSDVQRRQMTTVQDGNIHNIALDGTFDDCQNMVKTMFQHPEFMDGQRLTAVNSINWARIMAQIVYYFHAVLELDGLEDPLHFSVPTGNFGDVFAGYLAKKMGLPMGKLIVATNQNDILHRFFSANDYSMKAVKPTVSPSMDIQISSNFERLLFDLHNNDAPMIEKLMRNFKESGQLHVLQEIIHKARTHFDSGRADDKTIREVIQRTWENDAYLLDPHTAVGLHAGEACVSPSDRLVALATAHPAKFPEVVETSSGKHPHLPDHLSDLMERKENYERLPNDIAIVQEYIKKTA